MTWSLFEAYGIEIEYMIVAEQSLDVRAIADTLLAKAATEGANEAVFGDITWCNELAAHVVEMKTTSVTTDLPASGRQFAENVAHANSLLAEMGACLLPSGMHPWMDPHTELRLWPSTYNEIYSAYDTIFGCKGHGWANLQSMHINLPFANDDQFVRLHSAIRMVLPLISGLAASTPYADGHHTGMSDYRMEVYRTNSRRVPSVTGLVVPEPVSSIAQYHSNVLGRMYKDIAPLDTGKVLQEEWLNSRGAIARFDRSAIEIRTVDSQECPGADLAVAELIIALVRDLVEQTTVDLSRQLSWSSEDLAKLMRASWLAGEQTEVHEHRFLRHLGVSRSSATLAQVWGDLAERLIHSQGLSDSCQQVVEHILTRGTLARRLTSRAGLDTSKDKLRETYRQLADALAHNALFE